MANIGGSLYSRPGSAYLWMKYYVPGQSKPVRESTKVTNEKAAARVLKQRLGEVATGTYLKKDRSVTVGTLLDLFIADQELRQKKGLAKAKSHLTHLRDQFGTLSPTAIGTSQILAYIEKRRKVAPKNSHGFTKNATINRELEILRRAYRLGAMHEPRLVQTEPRIPRLKEDNVREGMLTHEDYIKLRTSLPAPYNLLLVCGYHLGTRLGELCHLEWSRVDLEKQEIFLASATTKTEKPRIVPIYGDMGEALQKEKALQDRDYPGCRWVFQRRGLKVVYSWERWNELVAQAGVLNTKFHDLRRTAVTNMIDAGISEKDAMAISGHATRNMLERYHIITRESIHRVGARMTEVFAHKNAAAGSVGTVSGTGDQLIGVSA